MLRWRRETILDIYTLMLGAFLFLTPWLFAYAHEPARADAWASSALLVATSLATVLAFAEWEEWAIMLLGLWVAASPWLLGFAHAKAMPITVLIGGAIVFLSALELWLIHYDPAAPGRDGVGPYVT